MRNKHVNKLIPIIILYSLFILLAGLVYNNVSLIDNFDKSVFQILFFKNPDLVKFFQVLTNIGTPSLTVIISIIGSILVSKRQKLFLVSSVLINTVANHYLKYIFQRPRPTLTHLVVVHGFSFPSGHTVAITALALSLQIIILQRTKKRTGIYLLAILDLLVISSRVILHVHFASDVLAGTLFASANTLLIKYLIFDIHATTFDS
ncbi:phosphatase PAP2 family protein [Bombilactobacillus bombi]|uniref:phosphatase PAP2 family protein n=1 Tax=Bombilactobacillus bombi TaxID=1303590 RepID=UPI0015E5C604|nr:phosphatase PAP2 family protein [Bombilactobacillus bombi]MBA1434917.1 phosphatase PAP2 family protein [Bombilactobacillus bombi]